MGSSDKKRAVIISCFDWYESRLKPIKTILEDKGYRVIVLTSDYDHIKKEKINRRNPDCIYISVKEYKKNISFARLNSHYIFAKKVLKQLNTIHPDLVYTLVPPNSVADVCKKYKHSNPNSKLVFDVIDLWPESMPGEKFHNTLPFQYWRRLRDNSLKEADHIFTECRLYQEKFDPTLRDKCSTLFLYKKDNKIFENMDKKKNQLKRKDGKNALKLCYLGSINHIIDIEGISHVVDILSRNYAVEVKVIGKGENKDAFLNALKKTGAEVNYYGAIYDEKEKFALLKDCDFALNMMVESVSVGLTTKSIDYLSYGLALINNIKGDTWTLVNEKRVGINYDGDDGRFMADIQDSMIRESKAIHEIYREMFSEEAFIISFKHGMKNIISK